MNPTPPPSLESELLTNLYTDEEKEEIRLTIEQAAANNRMTAVPEEFRPRKSGVLFPVLVNVAAVALVVAGWFGANAYFQTRQQSLQLRTDKVFSTESKLLTKVLEESKAQLQAKNQEIDKIKGDLEKAAQEKADLQRTFNNRVADRETALRKELADALAAEKKRLQDQGLGAEEVARRLKEFEAQKNAEFNSRLDTYRQQVQAEIDKRTTALTALQAKLQSTVADQEKLRQDIEKQTKEREKDLQTQLSSQAADLDQLKRDRDDLNAFFRQADTAMAQVKTAFDAADWPKTQAAVQTLRQVLAKASASTSEAVRTRALATAALATSLDTAALALGDSSSKTEANAQIEALKAQAKKEQALAAFTLAETQKTLSASDERFRQAQAQVESLTRDLDDAVARVNDLSGRTVLASLDQKTLTERLASLQATIDDLTPYKARFDTLKKLFSSSYPTAKERFVTTLGSEDGLRQFPDFDKAWQALQAEARADGTAAAARQRALDDVLSFTTYLQGTSTAAQAAKDASEKLVKTDESYRKVVESIQSLASAGSAETPLSTATTQLYGSVALVSGTKVVVEPLTKVRPAEGQTVELRRVQGKKETVLGRGTVLSASNVKVELDWTGNATVPLSGDAAYLVLP